MINNGGEVRTRIRDTDAMGTALKAAAIAVAALAVVGGIASMYSTICSLQPAVTLLDNVYSWIFLENKRTYLTSNRYISY